MEGASPLSHTISVRLWERGTPSHSGATEVRSRQWRTLRAAHQGICANKSAVGAGWRRTHAFRRIVLTAAGSQSLSYATRKLLAGFSEDVTLLYGVHVRVTRVASVYKRGQTYWIRFQRHGQEIRRSAKTSSKAIAQQYLAQILEETRRLDRGGRPRRTYKDAVERFASEYMLTLRPATQRRYRSSFRLLEPHFGDCYLDEINKTRLSDFVTARRRGGAMGATIRRDLATLSGICSCAVAWDYIDINPVKAFDKRHIREAPPRTSFPSGAEVERLIAHASPMVGRIIRFLAATGMRQEEAVSLEWSQVSIERREIRLTKTKTSSPRVVPLSDEALAVLIGTPRHITRHNVFWNSDGRRYTHFASQYRNIAKRAGVAWRCHDLRHRFASEFLMRTGDLPALQAILGHRTVTMTMRYSHLVTDHLHRAMARMGTNSGTGPAK